MGNWSDKLKKATKITVLSTYVKYYNSPATITSGYAGRLYLGTAIGVSYDKKYDAMKIIACESKPEAVGKWILSEKDDNGGTAVSSIGGIDITEANTTTDENGNIVPENTDAEGNTSGSSTDENAVYIDDAFFDMEYSTTYTNSKEYFDNLSEGLRVSDLRGILGMPHQFTPITDPRIDSPKSAGNENSFGRVYSEKIIKHIPLLLMTPGVPSFMTSYNESQRKSILNRLMNITEDKLENLFSGKSGKYYTLKYAYTEYFHYVNAMLRSAAYFLEIQNEKIDSKRLGSLNWLYETSTMGSEIFGHGNFSNFLGPYAGCVAFYADAGTSVDESFSNATTESQLSSALNNLSDTGRELNFLVGNIGSEVGLQLTALTGSENLESNMANVQSTIDRLIGKGNIVSNILNKAQTILAGGRILFPEIWSDSSFSRSYSCSMKLVSPSGDKLSVYLNILVPIYHLLAFTLPRQSLQQAYFSPFLVRAYYKGLFNVDMGIITGLSITKGDEGEWTLDGLPTVANVNFEIKDLYDGLFMSKQSSEDGYEDIMSNIQELDYIANSCGVNVNDQEIMRTVKMYIALGFAGIKDKITIDIFGNIAQFFNQKMNDIFGVF